MDRLEYLLINTQRYLGPINACIYIKSMKDYNDIQMFYLNHKLFRKYVTIHLVYSLLFDEPDNLLRNKKDATHSNAFYPANYFRNIARKNIKSMYLFYVDCDFIVPMNMHTNLKSDDIERISKNFDGLERKVVLIIPTYNTHNKDIKDLPNNRKELLELVKSKRINRVINNSQRFTNFNRFEKENSEQFYLVHWGSMLHYEPYFISPTSVPFYNERFIGCGRDKIENVVTTHLAGFKFVVWKKYFIVHIPHPPGITELCHGGWPPKSIIYHPLGTHYYMFYEEFYQTRKINHINNNKQVVLLDSSLVHNEWLSKFQVISNKSENLISIFKYLIISTIGVLILFYFVKFLKRLKK